METSTHFPLLSTGHIGAPSTHSASPSDSGLRRPPQAQEAGAVTVPWLSFHLFSLCHSPSLPGLPALTLVPHDLASTCSSESSFENVSQVLSLLCSKSSSVPTPVSQGEWSLAVSLSSPPAIPTPALQPHSLLLLDCPRHAPAPGPLLQPHLMPGHSSLGSLPADSLPASSLCPSATFSERPFLATLFLLQTAPSHRGGLITKAATMVCPHLPLIHTCCNVTSQLRPFRWPLECSRNDTCLPAEALCTSVLSKPCFSHEIKPGLAYRKIRDHVTQNIVVLRKSWTSQ